MKIKSLTRNWITIIGALIASINLLMIIVLFLISTIFNKNDTNLGLFIYIILPGFLLLGLLIVMSGAVHHGMSNPSFRVCTRYMRL